MKEQHLLDIKEVGTSKRAMKSAPKEKPNLKRDIQRAINWVDGNVLPLIALVILSGLAVRGLQVFLPEMNETTQTVAAIVAVSVLVVKLKSSDKV